MIAMIILIVTMLPLIILYEWYGVIKLLSFQKNRLLGLLLVATLLLISHKTPRPFWLKSFHSTGWNSTCTWTIYIYPTWLPVVFTSSAHSVPCAKAIWILKMDADGRSLLQEWCNGHRMGSVAATALGAWPFALPLLIFLSHSSAQTGPVWGPTIGKGKDMEKHRITFPVKPGTWTYYVCWCIAFQPYAFM
jgi:hypothetical protein